MSEAVVPCRSHFKHTFRIREKNGIRRLSLYTGTNVNVLFLSGRPGACMVLDDYGTLLMPLYVKMLPKQGA